MTERLAMTLARSKQSALKWDKSGRAIIPLMIDHEEFPRTTGRALMVTQERKQARREPLGKEEAKANPKIVEAGKNMKESIDNLVDAIDDVLETNAEAFVKNYMQQGGE